MLAYKSFFVLPYQVSEQNSILTDNFPLPTRFFFHGCHLVFCQKVWGIILIKVFLYKREYCTKQTHTYTCLKFYIHVYIYIYLCFRVPQTENLWLILIETKLVTFPPDFLSTNKHLDIVLRSVQARKIIVIELTYPAKEDISAA